MLTLIAAIAATAPVSSDLTIYNQGFALVKEQRNLDLKSGAQTMAVEDVASMIEPNSVSIQSLTEKGSFRVLEQNYQYDLISPVSILNKSVGAKIRFIRVMGTTREVLEGTLLSSPNAVVADPSGGSVQTYNGMVIRTDDGRIILNPQGEVEVLSIPEGLISRPTLLWEIDSNRAGTNKVELSYITRGMSWNSDYVLTLDGVNRAGLQGWVTISNQSGATFKNAGLKLLAGDVQRVQPAMMSGGMERNAARALYAADKNDFQEESLFEYHLYTLQRPATVRDKETKQLSLLEGADVPYTKKLILDATRQYGRYIANEGEIGTGPIKPQVRVEFENKKENGLGMPLPKGNVKVYQRDASGSVQLLGEDAIDHTPRNEKISLVVGRSFDVVGNRVRNNFRRINNQTIEETYTVEVRNRKETAETVYVMERSYGDWKITAKSQEFTKLDANTFQFAVNLKPNEVKQVTYTIQSKY